MLYVNKSAKKHIFSGSGTGGRELKSRHFDQISTVIMIRKRIVKAALVFYL